jgi:hypothetical protein
LNAIDQQNLFVAWFAICCKNLSLIVLSKGVNVKNLFSVLGSLGLFVFATVAAFSVNGAKVIRAKSVSISQVEAAAQNCEKCNSGK